MRICVIGGSGFIGTRLVKALVALGHDISIFDLFTSAAYPSLCVQGDVQDVSALLPAFSKHDMVIHLAAEHRDDVRPVSRYRDVNVGGAKNVVAAMQQHGVRRCLLVSSVAVYGLQQHEPDESSPLAPESPYGESKAAAEGIFRDWQAGDTQRSLVILRPVVVFGEHNRGNVHNLIEQIRRRRFLMVGRGENRKSVAYVGNLVDFMCTQIDAGSGCTVFNYADKPDQTIRDFVAAIDTALGNDIARRRSLPRWLGLTAGYAFDLLALMTRRAYPISSERVRKFCADTSVAADALRNTGFRPSVPIAEGLRRMIAASRDGSA